jgi:hypothetical protein
MAIVRLLSPVCSATVVEPSASESARVPTVCSSSVSDAMSPGETMTCSPTRIASSVDKAVRVSRIDSSSPDKAATGSRFNVTKVTRGGNTCTAVMPARPSATNAIPLSSASARRPASPGVSTIPRIRSSTPLRSKSIG